MSETQEIKVCAEWIIDGESEEDKDYLVERRTNNLQDYTKEQLGLSRRGMRIYVWEKQCNLDRI